VFNVEQLLEKIIKDAIPGQGGGKKGRKGQGKKGKKKGLLGSVASGPALMTAIGLGIGAYEIFKSKKKEGNTPPTPSSAGGYGSSFPPPPPPPLSNHNGGTERSTAGSVNVAPPSPPSSSAGIVCRQAAAETALELPREEIALRMIQVMVAAAHADGVLDEEEEKNILNKMGSVELTGEEKMFLLDELHNPRPVLELCSGIGNMSLAKGMYMMAVAAIEIDTEAERNWLDELGMELGLSTEVRRFIEEHGK
jgi:uncharacterized membrane protein YebE (DUF533 family)